LYPLQHGGDYSNFISLNGSVPASNTATYSDHHNKVFLVTPVKTVVPSFPIEGGIYYNKIAHVYRFWNNSSWIDWGVAGDQVAPIQNR